MPLKEFDTHSTTNEYMLDHFELLGDSDREIFLMILDKTFGEIDISQLVKVNWSESNLDLINFSSKKIPISETKMSIGFNCLEMIFI